MSIMRSRVVRDGPALVCSSGLTAMLTLGFWAVAARLHDPATVGRAVAEISTITLIGGFAQLNLLGFFLRFVPAAGHVARRFVLTGYAAIAMAAVAGGCVYLGLGLDDRSGTARFGPVLFVVAIGAQAVFVVQDGVLTALRRATWVPIENLATTGLRFVMLLLPAAVATRIGIAGAWFLPVLLAALLVSVVIVRLLSRASRTGEANAPSLPPRHELAGFVFAEYLNSLVNNAATFGPPLVVLHLVDVTGAAYFTVPWLVITTMQTLLWNVVMPFISESARSPHDGRQAARPTVLLGVALVGTATAVLVIAAPLVLGVQGGGFAAAGTPLLRLLAASIPFTAVVVLFSAIQVVRRRIWVLVAMNTAGASLLFAGMRMLLPSWGIAGTGVVHLAVQVALALLVLPAVLRWWRAPAPSAGSATAPVSAQPTTTGRARQGPCPIGATGVH